MGFSFLSNLFLYLLPLSLIPVILHLFFKKKPRHILFSGIRFIKMAARHVTPRKNIRQWLLLIVRCLTLIFLCLAFARPVGYISGFKGEKSNKQLAILIDCSYSMGYLDAGKTRLSKAKELAINLIDRYSDKLKQICVVSFSNSVEQYSGLTNNTELLKKFVQDITLTNNDTSLIPAVNFVYKIFSEFQNSDQSIVIITDMRGNLFGYKQKIENFDPKVKIVFVDVSEGKSQNVFIKDVSYSDLTFTFKISIFNSSETEQTRTLSLFIEDRNIFDGLVRIPPLKEFNYEIKSTQIDNDSEELWGKVQLSLDNLPSDDIFYFSFPVEGHKKILIVDGDPKLGFNINSETFYLNTVLSDKEYGNFIIKTYNPDEFKSIISLEKYDVVFLCNMAELNENNLENILCETIFISLGDKVDIKKYPDWIRENIENLVETEVSFSERQNGTDIFSDLDQFELKKIIFYKHFKLNNLNSREILNFGNGDIALIGKQINSKNIFIFASTIDRDWTNFPSKPFFPYFIRTIAEQRYEKQQQQNRFILEIKEPILYTSKTPVRFFDLTDPDGKKLQPVINVHPQETSIGYNGTNFPGIYELKFNSEKGTEFRHFAVNLSRKTDEGNLSKIDENPINQIFNGSPKTFVKFQKSPEDTAKEILLVLAGRELTKTFFTIVLILLGIETAITKFL